MNAIENTWPWRTGTQVGRTIYAMPPGSSYRNGEVLIGMMDSPEIAEDAVRCHNAVLEGGRLLHALGLPDPRDAILGNEGDSQ